MTKNTPKPRIAALANSLYCGKPGQGLSSRFFRYLKWGSILTMHGKTWLDMLGWKGIMRWLNCYGGIHSSIEETNHMVQSEQSNNSCSESSGGEKSYALMLKNARSLVVDK